MNSSKSAETFSTVHFADVVASMSRFLTRLAHSQVFGEGKLGLSEWVVLSILSQNDGISNNQLAKRLGFTNQRANQVVTTLRSSELVSVKDSREDARKKEIWLEPKGRQELDELNGRLKAALHERLAGKERAIARMHNVVRTITKAIVQPPKS